MSVNRLFDSVEKARDAAQWRAAFGEPQMVEGRTIIPVAQVGYGFGLGFGVSGQSPEGEEGAAAHGEGGGGGGGATSKPLGAIVVTPEDVYFEEVQDNTKIAIVSVSMVAFSIIHVARTLRVLFGRK
jgi:uncharacterized spore protein YtfJ